MAALVIHAMTRANSPEQGSTLASTTVATKARMKGSIFRARSNKDGAAMKSPSQEFARGATKTCLGLARGYAAEAEASQGYPVHRMSMFC